MLITGRFRHHQALVFRGTAACSQSRGSGAKLGRIGIALRRLNVRVGITGDGRGVGVVALVDRRVNRAGIAVESIVPAAGPDWERAFTPSHLAVTADSIGCDGDEGNSGDDQASAVVRKMSARSH